MSPAVTNIMASLTRENKEFSAGNERLKLEIAWLRCRQAAKMAEKRRLKRPEIWKNEVEAFRRLHGRRGFRRSLFEVGMRGGMTTDGNELEILPLFENGRSETAS